MTTFAEQHQRLRNLIVDAKRPLLPAGDHPFYSGYNFVRKQRVDLGHAVLAATCRATLVDPVYSDHAPVFDEHVPGRADVVFDHDLQFSPYYPVRLLRGWNAAQAAADDDAANNLGFPIVDHFGRPMEVGSEVKEMLAAAGEAFKPLALLQDTQVITPDQLAEHISWLAAGVSS